MHSQLIRANNQSIQKAGNYLIHLNNLLADVGPLLIPILKGYGHMGRYGFCTVDKKIVIDCIYVAVEPFNEGLAFVMNEEGKWGCIDRHGKVVIPFLFKYERGYSFRDGLAVVKGSPQSLLYTLKYEYLWGGIDKRGSVIIPFIYKRIYKFNEGLAPACNVQDKWGYVDNMGVEKILCRYDSAGHFDRDLAIVGIRDVKYCKFGVINKDGEVVIPCFYDGLEFEEELVVARLNEKHGVIDRRGNVILPLRFDSIKISEGLIVASYNKKIGVFDKSGNQTIQFEYHQKMMKHNMWISTYKEGLLQAGKDNKFGFVDHDGKIIVPFIYDEVKDFNEQIAAVKANKRWGFINKNGICIIPFLYDDVKDFNEGLSCVYNDGLGWGLIDTTGAMVINQRSSYNWLTPYPEGIVQIDEGDNDRYLVNTRSEFLVRADCGSFIDKNIWIVDRFLDDPEYYVNTNGLEYKI